MNVWRRDPPCAWHHNKEYLLNSLPTIESSILAFHGINMQLKPCILESFKKKNLRIRPSIIKII